MEASRKKNPKYKDKQRFFSESCTNEMTFEDCELAILRQAVDETEKVQKQKNVNTEDIKKIIRILEDFLIKKKLICYGGLAINNILPKFAQFYDRELEVPDYDFFSQNALEDAKELADIYFRGGYTEVEAKSGVHMGTFKVFVNFIPIADITFLDPILFNSMSKEAVTIAGIKYTPPNYLRMLMYLELSRPAGDVSRWEKVLKRLTLLNKFYPMKFPPNCQVVDFQRKSKTLSKDNSEKAYFIVRNNLIEQGVIFFGGYASSLYSKYLPKDFKRVITKNPDFDVLSEEPDRCAMILRERLIDAGFKNVETIDHAAIGEVVPHHVEVQVGKEPVAFIYEPVACHSYNTIQIGNYDVNVATIDTMLSFYLAFLYADKSYYDRTNILCMSNFLFEVEQKNRLEQRGLLKRFSINCYGKQQTLEDMRTEKSDKFKELKRGTKEYEMWFLKYAPGSDEKTKDKPKIVTGEKVIIEEKEKKDPNILTEEKEEKEDPVYKKSDISSSRSFKKESRKGNRTNKKRNQREREKMNKKNKTNKRYNPYKRASQRLQPNFGF